MEVLNYINGEWTKPNVTDYFDVINPATGKVIAKTPLGTKTDVDSAAKAASEAFNGWRGWLNFPEHIAEFGYEIS